MRDLSLRTAGHLLQICAHLKGEAILPQVAVEERPTPEPTPNGVELARFASAEPLDLGPGRKVLFLSRLERRKGLETLIQAMLD